MDATGRDVYSRLMKIAFLASKVTLPASPSRRADFHEHVQTLEALRPPLAEQGLELEDISWDDPGANWSDYAAAVIGTTWDYWDREDEFIAALEAIESRTRLFNPLALVKWNRHKRYLETLAARGARLIPTLWLDTPTPQAVGVAFERLGTDRLVLKRQVGAGAAGQHLLHRGGPVPDMPLAMMAQPYLPAIETEGEMSFVFIDGDLSHALVKRPKPGDYRIQSLYGGVEEAICPDRDDICAARDVLDLFETPPLYARVDMLRGDSGGLFLMELELIEPFLYPLQGPQLGPRYAAALARRLR
jgi:hypothetical protein